MKMRFVSGLLFVIISSTFTVSSAVEKITLRFVTLEFSPFVYSVDGVVSGPGADVIAALCNRMNITCDFALYPWRRAQLLVKAGEAEAMMVVGRNPKREEWVRFSPPVFQTEYGYFVRAENRMHYRDDQDVQGYTVGVFSPSNTANSLRNIQAGMMEKGLKPIVIDERPDDDSGFKKLAVGRLDAVYSNRDRGNEVIRKHKLSEDIRYAGANKSLQYYVGFSRAGNDPRLLDRFDRAYLELYREGTVEEILKNYHLQAAINE
jgi:polar amino acid transport system substrate-binding protein